MKLSEACEIITRLSKEHGEGVLETLVYMRDNLDDFELNEQIAFRVFFQAGQRMFATA